MEDKTTTARFSFETACTEKEYALALHTTAFRVGRLRFWPLVALASAALLLGDLQAIVLHTLSPAAPLSLLLIAAAVLLPVWFSALAARELLLRLRREWPVQELLGVKRRCTGYTGGLILSAPAFQKQIAFVDCRMLVEKKDLWLIIQNRSSFIVIPKRDVPAQDQQAFAEFLRHAFLRGRAFGR